MKKIYVIEENSKLTVIGVMGFIPDNNIGELVENINIQDYPYIKKISVGESFTFSIDQDLIDADLNYGQIVGV